MCAHYTTLMDHDDWVKDKIAGARWNFPSEFEFRNKICGWAGKKSVS